MAGSADIDTDLRRALESALAGCRQALTDYQAGLLSDDDVRRTLFHHGLVRHGQEAWLLDLQSEQWWRYDGLGLGAARAPLTNAGVARLRHSIDVLTRELGTEEQTR